MINPLAKLWSQPEAIGAFVADDWMAPPVNVEIAPTIRCNAKCPWCFYAPRDGESRPRADDLPWPTLRQCLSDLAGFGVKAVSWTGGGEPSLYPSIEQAIEHGAGLQLRQGLFTNGYGFVANADQLAWVRISITDRLSVPSTARRYACSTYTGVVVNVTQDNLGQLERLVLETKASGAHYFQARPALASHWSEQPDIACPTWLNQHATGDFQIVLTEYKWQECHRPHAYPICHGHRLVPFIWPDGSVATCGYHYQDAVFTFGNLRTASFLDIWSSQRRRQMLDQGVRVISTCQHCCKQHETNKALARLRGELPTYHAEFV